MSNETIILAVLCLVYHEDKILLQNRVAHNWPGVTFPGGHVEQGESFVEAIKREIKEETGLSIKNPRICGVKQFRAEPNERYVVILFKTNEFSGQLSSSEEGKMCWVKRADIDSCTLAPDFKELLRIFDEEDLQELVYRSEKVNMQDRIELH